MKPENQPKARKVSTMRTILIGLLTTLFACAVEAQPINFGQDQCHFCKMTIVDKQFAAQCVTKKGKQFKYDATECMVNELQKTGSESDMQILLVSNYRGGPMLAAASATYLICPKIKSPMGAFLSAFATQEEGFKANKEHGGEVYTWQKLKEKLSTNHP